MAPAGPFSPWPIPNPGGYRLAQAESNATPAQAGNDAASARFAARVVLFLRRQIGPPRAADLAGACHQRDSEAGTWAWCVECAHLSGGPRTWRCGNHRAARVGRDLPDAIAMQSQRCPGFVGVTL